LFDVEMIKTWLNSKDGRSAPQPRTWARLRAVPKSDASGSYNPVITALKWLPDSTAVLFLGEGQHGNRQLYRADLSADTIRALTPPGRDVRAFDVSASRIIYRSSLDQSTERGYSINADARDITGIPLQAVLFPGNGEPSYLEDLWVLEKG